VSYASEELDGLEQLYDEEYPFIIQCKYCGQKNLAWSLREQRWRLLTSSGEIHVCRTVWKSDTN